MPRSQSRPTAARWAVPATLAAAVGVGVVAVPIVADADPGLPPRTAAELLSSVARADEQPFSGTVVETAELGLPALPSSTGGGGSTSLTSLLAGSNTARVWYAGPDKARFALLGSLAETDVIRDGRDLWVWRSDRNEAKHAVLPASLERAGKGARAGTEDQFPGPIVSLTPQQAAERALAAVDPTTRVRVDGTARIAGRSAYELVLEPRDDRSLVSSVRLAVDSENSMPLRVQVFADGSGDPAFETGFTAVSFNRPADAVFRFSPPPGAKVEETGPAAAGSMNEGLLDGEGTDDADAGAGRSGAASPTVVGKGWTAVAVSRGTPLGDTASSDPTLGTLLRATTPVQGGYGSGRLLRTALVSVLLLDDGRSLIGAVEPEVLFEAATSATSTGPARP